MSITYDNYLGKLVLNTNDARIEGSEYVWDNVNLPITNIADKSVIDMENVAKCGGCNYSVSRTLYFTANNTLRTDYDYSNIFEFENSGPWGGSTTINTVTDYIYFQTSNSSPIFRFRFNSNNIVVGNPGTHQIRDYGYSTNGTTWTAWTTEMPLNTPLNITERYFTHYDNVKNNFSLGTRAKLYFSNNGFTFTTNGVNNGYSSLFTGNGSRYTYFHYYIPSLDIYCRLVWVNTTGTSSLGYATRNAAQWASSNGGISYYTINSTLGNIPFPTSEDASVGVDIVITNKISYPLAFMNGSTILNLTNLTNPTTYDSSTKANTRQLATLSYSPVGSGMINKKQLYYNSISRPILYNFGQVGFPIRLNISSTLAPTKRYYLPYGDNLQLTLKLFKYDEQDEPEAWLREEMPQYK